jgi:hypothetical protein
MPLIYGEGWENAFRRLREEINKQRSISQLDSQLSIPSAARATASLMAGPKDGDRCELNPEFKEHRKFAETENTPWIEARESALKGQKRKPKSHGEPNTHEESDESESDASKFMHGPDEGDICRPRVDRVGSFCAGGTLEFLKSEQWNREKAKSPLALLDERTLQEGNVRSSKKRRPLDAQELYRELRKPVSHSHHEFSARRMD